MDIFVLWLRKMFLPYHLQQSGDAMLGMSRQSQLEVQKNLNYYPSCKKKNILFCFNGNVVSECFYSKVSIVFLVFIQVCDVESVL